MSTTTSTGADCLSHPTHSCFIYQNPDQQIEFTARFLKVGLGKNEQCVFLEMPSKLELVQQALKRLGVDVDAQESRGALLLSARRDYLSRGKFDGKKTLQFLQEAVADALARGFDALRITGDLNWELGDEQDFHSLVQYEAELDQFVLGHPIVGLCQYQRYSVSSLAICNALETHENVLLGNLFCNDNPYYEPPEVKLEPDIFRREQRRGEWKCRQLSRIMAPPERELSVIGLDRYK